MPRTLKNSHYTGVVPRFQRSINLFSDRRNTDILSGYIVTPNVTQSLQRLVQALCSPEGQRAFALIGPYGTGKSAFAVFLSQLLGKERESVSSLFHMLPDELRDEINHVCSQVGRGKGFLPITVTARRRPVAQLLLEGFLVALSELRQKKSLRDLKLRLEKVLQDKTWQDTAVVLDCLSAVKSEAEKQGVAGILLFVDEAGKTLEYALQDRGGGDVYIFQELAEYANRQMQFPLLFLITLHQMFDDYVELSDRTLRNEWNKVQERFQSIQFNESPATTIRLVASAFKSRNELPVTIAAAVEDAVDLIKKGAMPLPVGIDFDEFSQLALQSWPLHPSVLLAMPYLFRRLAQNERSIFSYLTSLEPFGLQDFLAQAFDEENSFIRLHHLYVYFLSNFEAGLSRLPHAKRLLEANDIINSRLHLTASQLELVRSVALLNVLSEICPLKATPSALACVVANQADFESNINFLKQQSILTYRRFDGSYRVWEGSDVDIEARMQEARRKLQMEGVSPLETLCQHLPKRTVVARRHALETGIPRYFNLIYAENLGPQIINEAETFGDAAGTIIVLLPQAETEVLIAKVCQVTRRQTRLVVAMPRQIDMLRAMVEEVACFRWVEENTEELRDDKIARRELSLRLAMGELHIAQHLQTLLDPRPAPIGNFCQWFWHGEEQKPVLPVDVTRLLSKVCDEIYRDGPKVRNELIMRKKLSSAAASARRCLLERMLEHRSEKHLGIEGYPPERSIYESVLLATEIHYFNPKIKKWDFQAPPRNNPKNLRSSWDLIETTIFSQQIKRVELVDLFERLIAPPFGLPLGVLPLLFTAFYLFYQDELFLYREGTFVPELQAAHLELLQRRPDLFSFSGAKLDGTRKAVVERLARGLDQPAKTASVVRNLYHILNSLPPITLRSARIEDEIAKNLRDCLSQASSPEELLFADLPRSLGLDPFNQGENRPQDMDLFFERLNHGLTVLLEHARSQMENHRNLLLIKCGLTGDMDGWHELERRATWLAPRVKHQVLTPFLNCVNNGIAENHNPKPALSLIAERPFEQWTDLDIENFPGLADGIGGIFRQVWANYGDIISDLSEDELRQKEKLEKKLRSQIQKVAGDSSPRVLAAALRTLLNNISEN